MSRKEVKFFIKKSCITYIYSVKYKNEDQGTYIVFEDIRIDKNSEIEESINYKEIRVAESYEDIKKLLEE